MNDNMDNTDAYDSIRGAYDSSLNTESDDDLMFRDNVTADDQEPLIGSQLSSRHCQDEMASKPRLLPQYIAAICATIGGIAMGTVLGYSSPAGAILTNPNITSPNSSDFLTVTENSWFSSSANLGALVGGPVGGICINLFGRKGTMIYCLVPFLVGWILLIGAENFAMLLLGRVITGFSMGIVSLAVPTYIGEFASPSIRGTLGSGFQLMVVIGILYSYSMGAAFTESFRWIAAVCAVVPCVFSASMIFNKETPSYLLSKHKDQEAEESLRHFRGQHYEGITTELKNLRASLEQSRVKKASLGDLKKPYIMKPLIISLGLMIFQQFSGINAVLFNLTTIFNDAGSSMSANLASIIVGIMQVIATGVAAAVSDKLGRKILLLLSSALMAVSLVALGAFFYLEKNNPETAEDLGWLPLLALIVFVMGFSVGFGPIPWLMMGELFSPEVKELASGIATMTNWTFAFITTLIFSPLQHAIYDYGVYWMFAASNVAAFLFVITFVFETKGHTLHEICVHFGAPQKVAEGGSNVNEGYEK